MAPLTVTRRAVGHTGVDKQIPSKQQTYNLALGGRGGFPNDLCVESVVHRMALLGKMKPSGGGVQ